MTTGIQQAINIALTASLHQRPMRGELQSQRIFPVQCLDTPEETHDQYMQRLSNFDLDAFDTKR